MTVQDCISEINLIKNAIDRLTSYVEGKTGGFLTQDAKITLKLLESYMDMIADREVKETIGYGYSEEDVDRVEITIDLSANDRD